MHTEEANNKVSRWTMVEAWSFSFACMIGWAAFVMPATFFLPIGGVKGSMLAFLSATVAMIIVSLNYHYLANLYPRQGGIYNLVLNALGSDHAFAASWAMGLAHMCCIPLNAQALSLLARTLTEEAFHFKYQTYLLQSNIPLMDAVIIAIVLVALGYMNARGIKHAARYQTVGAFTLLAGIVIMLVAAFLKSDNPAKDFTPAYLPNTNPTLGFMMIFILTPWAYVGFDSISKIAPAMGLPAKKLGRIMIVSVVCGSFAYMANFATALLGMPEQYAGWPEYLEHLNQLSGIDAYPVLNAARGAMGHVGIAIFFIAGASATLTGLIGFSASISRLVYQMGRAGALPRVLGELDPKRGTPVNASRVVVVFSFLLVVLIRTFESIEELASVATTVGFGYCSIAALLQALRHKHWRYAVTGALGLLVCLVWALFQLFPVPGISGAVSPQAVVFITVWIFLGITAYAFSSRSRKKQSVILEEE